MEEVDRLESNEEASTKGVASSRQRKSQVYQQCPRRKITQGHETHISWLLVLFLSASQSQSPITRVAAITQLPLSNGHAVIGRPTTFARKPL